MAETTPQTSLFQSRSFSTNVPLMSSQTPPTNSRPTIPSFSKSIRSLLPFGPGKSTTSVSYSSPNLSSPNVSSTTSPISPSNQRAPFFGTVRMSLSKEREKGKGKEQVFTRDSPHQVDNLDDVIAIGPDTESEVQISPEPSIRRSFSYPRLERDQEQAADLSTILEADTSGISKHVPDISSSSLSSPSPPPVFSPLPEHPANTFIRPDLLSQTSSTDASESSLSPFPSPELPQPARSPYVTDQEADLSTSQVPEQVMHALRSKDSKQTREWLMPGQPLVLDADDDEGDAENHDDENLTQRASINTNSIQFDNVDPDLAALLSPNHLAPRLAIRTRTLSSLSDQEYAFSRNPSPFNSLKGRGKSPQDLRALTTKPTTSSLPRTRLVHPPSPASSNPPPEISVPVRQASPDRRLQHSYQPTPPSPLSSSRLSNEHENLARPAVVPRLITPMRHHKASNSQTHIRPSIQRMFTSASTSHLMESPYEDAPSAARPNLDDPRPSSRSQLRMRMRKRSMSVEGSGPGSQTYSGSADYLSRSATSLSQRDTPRAEMIAERPKGATWLGPRATKAFADAGLLDRDGVERESYARHLYSVDQTRSATPSSLLRRGSERSAGEFRSYSRLAHSESGRGSTTPDNHGIYTGRRGSGGYSGSVNHASGGAYSAVRAARERGGSVSASVTGSTVSPVMESPTFTDRGRGTPMTASTAPTSAMSSAGDRERDTEKFLQREIERVEEDARRLREMHASEMTALLSALADSQTSTRRLRVENAELRAHLEDTVRELDAVRSRAEEWKWEAETLRERAEEAKTPQGGATGGYGFRWKGLGRPTSPRHRTPSTGSRWNRSNGLQDRSTSALGLGLPTSVAQRQREALDLGRSASSLSSKRSYDTPTHGRSASIATPASTSSPPRHIREKSEVLLGSRRLVGNSRLPTPRRFQQPLQPLPVQDPNEEETFQFGATKGAALLMAPSSTPAATKTRAKAKTEQSQHERRGSTTSSIFPSVPDSMTMLLHDSMDEDGLGSEDVEPSLYQAFRMTPSASRAIKRKSTKPGHFRTKSVSSTGGVSIISATEMSGSPGNLSLSSEHARHLGDLESVSLQMPRSMESGAEDGDADESDAARR